MKPPTDRVVSWLLFLAPAAVYICLPTKDYYWDGVGFAQAIELAHGLSTPLLHPNHLFYDVVGYLEYSCALRLGLHARALAVLQAANGLLGAAAVPLIYSLLRRSAVSGEASAILSLVFAFSATWWKYSTDADAYIAAVLLLILCSELLLSDHSRPHLLAVVHAAAILIHELAIIFMPAALVALWRHTRGIALLRRCTVLGMYVLETGLLTIGTYAIAFRLVKGHLSFAGLLGWATSRSSESKFSLSPLPGLPYVVRGSIRLLFATSGDGFPCDHGCMFLRGLLLACCAACLISVIAISLRHRAQSGVKSEMRDVTSSFALVWIGAYLFFLLFWEPTNTFYRLFYLPPLILLAGLGMGEKKLKVMLPLLFVLTFMLNFGFLILPASRAGNNWGLTFAEDMHDRWNNRTTVFYFAQGGASIFDWTVRYFNPEARWVQLPSSMNELERQLKYEEGQGRSSWLDTSAMEQSARDPALQSWVQAHSVPHNEAHERRGRYEIWYRQVRP